MRRFSTFLSVCCLAGSAYAVEIYAPNNLGTPSPGSNTLIRFDSAAPAAWVTVGNMNQPNIGFGGMDFDGAGNLWAYASYVSSTGAPASGLYTVNTATGNATLVGTPSGQPLQDLAWDPTSNTMYGVNSSANVATLYTVDLGTGATAPVGNFTGLPATNLEVGLAIDSAGNRYVHDIASDMIFKGAGLNMTSSILLSRNTNFSQGMTIDWSRNDQGYHGTIGNTPSFFSHLYTFPTSLASWTDLGTFGTPDGTFPTVETGDLAIRPIPEPATLGMLVLAGGMLLRRRK